MTFERVRRRLERVPQQVEPSPLLRWAAVAAVLVPGPDELLLVRRAERPGDPWSGQMALPGGRQDAGEDLLFTAIRETAEEVGIHLPPEALLGVLDDVAPRTPVLPPIAVRPFVFRLPERPRLRPNAEIADSSWVSLALLLEPEIRALVEVDSRAGRLLVPAYRLEAGTVWGMTERIVSDLLG